MIQDLSEGGVWGMDLGFWGRVVGWGWAPGFCSLGFTPRRLDILILRVGIPTTGTD